MVSNSLPLRHRVPYWAGIATLMLVLLMTTMANGTSIGSAPEFVGALSVVADDIQMGYYSTAAGLCIVLPVIPKLKVIYTPKTLLLLGLTAESVLSWICAQTDDINILIIASFFSGIAKGILVMTCIPLLSPFVSPKGNPYVLTCRLFMIVLSGGQISMLLTAYLSEQFQWQYIYYVITVICLISIFLIMLLFRYAQLPVHFLWREIDVKSIFFVATTWLAAIFIFSYGQHLDWFESDKIKLLASVVIILFILFVFQNYNTGQRFVYFRPLLRREGVIGYSFTILTVLLTSSGLPINTYLTTVLGIDNIHSNILNLRYIPGFVAGGYICILWYNHHFKPERLISLAIAFYAIYMAMAYFSISIDAEYDTLKYGNILRGAGMIILFAGITLYIIEELDLVFRPSHVFWLLSIRSAVGPVAIGALLTFFIYQMTTESMTVLCEQIRMDNYSAALQYTQGVQNAIRQGHSEENATLLAVNSLYGQVYRQATMVAVKRIIGYLLVLFIAVSVITPFIPFFKSYTPSSRYTVK